MQSKEVEDFFMVEHKIGGTTVPKPRRETREREKLFPKPIRKILNVM